MGAAEEPVHVAGATLGEHRHTCAFFNNAAEEYRVLLPFNTICRKPAVT
jgi:hypothetical protein